MAYLFELHDIVCKCVTIHTGGTTITQSENGVACLYFPEPSSPEHRKVGGEFYFETSDTKITLIPDVALNDDVLDEPKKTNDGQIVFTLDIGSFTLKVNGFTAKLKYNNFTKKSTFTIRPCDSFDWIFLCEGGEFDEVAVIAMTYDDRRRLKDLREGDLIPFPGVDYVTYEVTEVVRDKGWRTTVTIQACKDGAPVGQPYTMSGDDISWFVPSIPPLIS